MTITTVDTDPDTRPDMVGDIAEKGLAKRILRQFGPSKFDVYEWISEGGVDYKNMERHFDVLNNAVSSLRTDGNGFILMKLGGTTLNKMHHAFNLYRRKGGEASHKTYTPFDSNDMVSITDADRAQALVDYITRVTGFRYGKKGRLSLVCVPMSTVPPNVRKYLSPLFASTSTCSGPELKDMYAFRVVRMSDEEPKWKKRDALNARIDREHAQFVSKLLEFLKTNAFGDFVHALNTRHPPLELNDVYTMMELAIQRCSYVSFATIVSMFPDTAYEMRGDLEDDLKKKKKKKQKNQTASSTSPTSKRTRHRRQVEMSNLRQIGDHLKSLDSLPPLPILRG